jgi:hypothetical protein
MDNITKQNALYIGLVVIFIIVMGFVIHKYSEKKMKKRLFKEKRRLRKYYEQQFNQMFYQNQENEQSVPNINPPLNIEQNHIDDSVNSHQNNNDEIDGMDSGSSYSSLSSSKDGSHASALDNPKILDDTYKNNNFSRRG